MWSVVGSGRLNRIVCSVILFVHLDADTAAGWQCRMPGVAGKNLWPLSIAALTIFSATGGVQASVFSHETLHTLLDPFGQSDKVSFHWKRSRVMGMLRVFASLRGDTVRSSFDAWTWSRVAGRIDMNSRESCLS